MGKMIKSINPYSDKVAGEYEAHSSKDIEKILENASDIFLKWKKTPLVERANLLRGLSAVLLENKERYARLITEEMGKPIAQSRSEIEKCAWVCDFYAENATLFLADSLIATEAQESFISYDPLGCILAIMPWNFPFWQVFRFAVPTITAGNVALLKHASNVTGCSLAIQELFEKAGYPKGCFQTLLIGHAEVEELISNDFIKGVSLTGSEKAGRAIAQLAGKNLKRTVLELGGNNACIIWEDADLDKHIDTIINARMQNAGQSCIAAKRFIVVAEIYNDFLERFKKGISKMRFGNPEDEDTEIATMARKDLAEELGQQVEKSIGMGAKVFYGNSRDGAFYEPTILTEVSKGMPAFEEELFGPVAAVIKVKNREESIELANTSRFGLGTMLFTEDIEAARKAIGKIEDGAFFINEMVKSDPRLPFGGTKASGYGRELSREGIWEFVNKKTVYVK